MFPGRQIISTIYLAPFVIVAYESLNCPQGEKNGSQNHTFTVGKGH